MGAAILTARKAATVIACERLQAAASRRETNTTPSGRRQAPAQLNAPQVLYASHRYAFAGFSPQDALHMSLVTDELSSLCMGDYSGICTAQKCAYLLLSPLGFIKTKIK